MRRDFFPVFYPQFCRIQTATVSPGTKAQRVNKSLQQDPVSHTSVFRIYRQPRPALAKKRKKYNGKPAANADRRKLFDASADAATGRYALLISLV